MQTTTWHQRIRADIVIGMPKEQVLENVLVDFTVGCIVALAIVLAFPNQLGDKYDLKVTEHVEQARTGSTGSTARTNTMDTSLDLPWSREVACMCPLLPLASDFRYT